MMAQAALHIFFLGCWQVAVFWVLLTNCVACWLRRLVLFELCFGDAFVYRNLRVC